MPLCSNPGHCSGRRQPTPLAPGMTTPGSRERASRCLTIGLINNMPDAALDATERQFRSLLHAASDGITVRLVLYALPTVLRSESGERHIASFYSNIEELWETELDGLIVTGAEPRAASLTDEPYWRSFARVVDWAREHTQSTIFSCLAAHAAVLQLDGIGRQRSDHKRFGVFECARLSDHPLMSGAPSHFKLPHSRWNGLSEEELTAHGYSVLTRSPDVGVDTFIKQEKALFVFFQGHPEYDSDTLLREYRRDVGRYLKGESDSYPREPQSYFDEETRFALASLRDQARSRGGEDLLPEVAAALETRAIDNTWNSTAACIYKNWLHYIRDRKEQRRPFPLVHIGADTLAAVATTLSDGARVDGAAQRI